MPKLVADVDRHAVKSHAGTVAALIGVAPTQMRSGRFTY